MCGFRSTWFSFLASAKQILQWQFVESRQENTAVTSLSADNFIFVTFPYDPFGEIYGCSPAIISFIVSNLMLSSSKEMAISQWIQCCILCSSLGPSLVCCLVLHCLNRPWQKNISASPIGKNFVGEQDKYHSIWIFSRILGSRFVYKRWVIYATFSMFSKWSNVHCRLSKRWHL